MRTQHFRNLTEWFNEIFHAILPRNIKFAADIYLCFACTHEESSNGIVRFHGFPQHATEERNEIARQFVEIACQTLVTPENIIQTCFASTSQPQNSLNYVLRRYCNMERIDRIRGGGNVSDWNRLAPILLEGLQSQDNDTRNKIYVLTAHLVGDFNARPGNGQHYCSFSMDKLVGPLFGNNVRRIMELLSNIDISSNACAWSHDEACTLVQNAAREWLKESSNPLQNNLSNE
ncbi:MAG: hypothetical protein LBG58_11315 [Planctomycetaceae bacterium]|jgi:hypothetical protein|nr:hypothetical protein [Planctomycetaceae bacterium]